MANEWLEETLQRYIDTQTEEGSNLEYKAAPSLEDTVEITKDISAMANAGGGTIIYGIAEWRDRAKKHLPERLSPVDRTKYSKEWLEQIINTIKPRIVGFQVFPVQLSFSDNDVAYVVTVPMSTTAHQARDHKYYRRYNFQCLPMEDHEIRDVMNRNVHPRIELNFQLEVSEGSTPSISVSPAHKMRFVELNVFAENIGVVYAQYVVADIYIPFQLLYSSVTHKDEIEVIDETEYVSFRCDNQHYDIKPMPLLNTYTSIQKPTGLYSPVLPKNTRYLSSDIKFVGNFDQAEYQDLVILWTVYADNAQPIEGKIKIADIDVLERDLDD